METFEIFKLSLVLAALCVGAWEIISVGVLLYREHQQDKAEAPDETP